MLGLTSRLKNLADAMHDLTGRELADEALPKRIYLSRSPRNQLTRKNNMTKKNNIINFTEELIQSTDEESFDIAITRMSNFQKQEDVKSAAEYLGVANEIYKKNKE